jgi:hypothetical protein
MTIEGKRMSVRALIVTVLLAAALPVLEQIQRPCCDA